VPIERFGYLPLIPLSGKGINGEWVTIIQHPGGEPKQMTVRNSGLDSYLQREQDRGREGAAETSVRPQANQGKGLVRTHRSSDAWRNGLDVRPDALDAVAASIPAIPGSGCTSHVRCVLYRRYG